MPEKTLHIALLLATAVAVGTLGYLAGFKSAPELDRSFPSGHGGGETATASPEVAASGPDDEAGVRVEDVPIVANGVGSIDREGVSSSAREAFLEASEKRSTGAGGGRGAGVGADGFEEDSRTSDEDIAELAGRMEALEQAFAVDGRRNRGRGNGVGGEEIDELKETVANLYDIVGGLPSLDTLETKVAAVDGAIEEMNATMERLVELGSRMEDLASGGGEQAGKTTEAVQRMQEELSKLAETSANTNQAVDALQSEVAKNSESAASTATAVTQITKQLSQAEASVADIKAAVDGVKRSGEGESKRLDSLSAQLSVMDKNLRSAVEGYKKVYENAARTEKRFVAIEAFLGDIETRMGAVEANFGPAQ